MGGIVTQGTHHWRRNQTAVTTATFMGFTGFTLVMPFLPLYFEQLGVHDPPGGRDLVGAEPRRDAGHHGGDGAGVGARWPIGTAAR